MSKQLINIQTRSPLVEFHGRETIFYNKFLEKEMRTLGIPIPPGLRSFYRGKEQICLEDEDFQKAFLEIYYVTSIDPTLFHWLENESR